MSTTKYSEWLTRKRLIDPQLESVRWKVMQYSADLDLANSGPLAIEEYPTDNGPADYVLCVDGQILGIVEAKKLTLGPQNVLTQAQRYAQGLIDNPFNFDGLHVPFLYSTNGEVIWHHDTRRPLNRSRRIAHFHGPDALRERLAAESDNALQRLATLANDHPHLRPYQAEANSGIERAIEDNKRQMLVAMATGTGKTFTMVNQCYRLMKSGVAGRILFLVDRRTLAAQEPGDYLEARALCALGAGECPCCRRRAGR
jgi:type I restriction enzyme R subunit